MVRRCYCSTEPSFTKYGKIGIKVCDEWKEDFFSFKNWAISNGYEKHLTLDRKKSDKNYCPENCRWGTIQQNNFNRRSFKGISQYKGVCYDKTRNKWRSYIKINGRQHHIGRYDTELEAARRYNEKAKILFGKFACLNEIK